VHLLVVIVWFMVKSDGNMHVLVLPEIYSIVHALFWRRMWTASIVII